MRRVLERGAPAPLSHRRADPKRGWRGALHGYPWVLLFLTGCTHSAPVPRNAVIVVIDALRADHLGCYGYQRPTSPHIDQLAASGTRFVHGISTTPWTLPSVATLLTSSYPSVHGARLPSNVTACMAGASGCRVMSMLDQSRTTLAEVLQRNGFSTAAFVPGRGYVSSVFGFNQGYDVFMEDDVEARFIVASFAHWLDTSRPKQFFAYLHFMEVHAPYTGPDATRYRSNDPDPARRARAEALAEEVRRYRGFDFDPEYRGTMNGTIESIQHLGPRRAATIGERDLEHLVALYDQGIAYTDYWIGELMQELQRRGLEGSTVLLVTGDHGDEFHEHGGFDHGATYYEEMMRVPYVLRVPGLGNGLTIDAQVGLIDVMPTLLDLLGVKDQPPMQGRSLRALLNGGTLPERPLFAEGSMIPGVVAMRTNDWKFVRPTAGGPELYDLRADPREQANLCATDRDRCAPFMDQLRTLSAEVDRPLAQQQLPTPRAAVIDEQTHERLRRLGYE